MSSERMDPENATDVVEELDSKQRRGVLAETEPGLTAAVAQLLRYRAETAGRLMMPSIIAVSAQ